MPPEKKIRVLEVAINNAQHQLQEEKRQKELLQIAKKELETHLKQVITKNLYITIIF